jgi:hypothetical protein
MGVDVDLRLFNLETYRQRVLPAYDTFRKGKDASALVTLLEEALERLPHEAALPGPRLWSAEVYAEAIEILAGRGVYEGDRDLFAEGVASDLATFFCVERGLGVDPERDVSRTPLVRHLYAHSEWLQDVFTFAVPLESEPLDIPLGESSEALSREEVGRLRDEVARVPRPMEPGTTQADYDHLVTFLDTALARQYLTVVLTIS